MFKTSREIATIRRKKELAKLAKLREKAKKERARVLKLKRFIHDTFGLYKTPTEIEKIRLEKLEKIRLKKIEKTKKRIDSIHPRIISHWKLCFSVGRHSICHYIRC